MAGQTFAVLSLMIISQLHAISSVRIVLSPTKTISTEFPETISISVDGEITKLTRVKANNVKVFTMDNSVFKKQPQPNSEKTACYRDESSGTQIRVTKQPNQQKLVLTEGSFIKGKKLDSIHKTEDGSFEATLTDTPRRVKDGYLKAPPNRRQRKTDHKTSEEPTRQKVASSLTSDSAYTVDVAAFVGYKIYQNFVDRAEDKSEAAVLQDIHEYYAYTFIAVDLRYQTTNVLGKTIRVSLNKIVVARFPFQSSFIENNVDHITNQLESEAALDAFTDFTLNEGSDIFSDVDHSVLFSGYDLYDQGWDLLGLAYISEMCFDSSTSIVEDSGFFQHIDTTAHEIGHSLGAEHDGEGNDCPEEGYIMAGLESGNTLYFSSCSINYFESFIQNDLTDNNRLSCLRESLSVSDEIPDLQTDLPGLKFSVHDQCVNNYGSNAYLCRGEGVLDDVSEICSSMYCTTPDIDDCYPNIAAPGTPCGDGKICLGGECVSDARGVEIDDTCPFGDRVGVVSNGQTCSEFVALNPGRCYDGQVYMYCCASCNAIRKRAGCEFGDMYTYCMVEGCTSQSQEYRQACCDKCNYSQPQVSPSLTVSPVSSGISPGTDVTLTCQVDTNGYKIYSFRKDNDVIFTGAYSTYIIQSAGSLDSGVYSCLVYVNGATSGLSNRQELEIGGT